MKDLIGAEYVGIEHVSRNWWMVLTKIPASSPSVFPDMIINEPLAHGWNTPASAFLASEVGQA